MSTSIRVDDDLYQQAKLSSKAEFRTISRQIEYWACVGRAALDNPDLPVDFIRDIIVAREEESLPFELEKD